MTNNAHRIHLLTQAVDTPLYFHLASSALKDVSTRLTSRTLSVEYVSVTIFDLICFRDNLLVLQSYNEPVSITSAPLSSEHIAGLVNVLPMLAIIDEALKEYLSVQTTWTDKERFVWFIKKVNESLEYLEFCKARDVFLRMLRGQMLPTVQARIDNEAADVEAGKFSFRDVCILVERISRELAVFEAASYTPD